METKTRTKRQGPKMEFHKMIERYKTMDELYKLQKWYAQEPEAGMNAADKSEYFGKREYLRLEIERREFIQRRRTTR